MNKSLTLIDSSKFNDLLNAFEEERKEKKLLRGIVEPKLQQMLMANEKMKQGDISDRENAVIQFLRKKDKFLEGKTEKNNPPPINNEKEEEKDGDEKQLQFDNRDAEKIAKFIKHKKIMITERMQSDLVHDLSHQRAMQNLNLGERSLNFALTKLKKSKMPVSYIKNRGIRTMYKNMIDGSASESSDEFTSRIPRSRRGSPLLEADAALKKSDDLIRSAEKLRRAKDYPYSRVERRKLYK